MVEPVKGELTSTCGVEYCGGSGRREELLSTAAGLARRSLSMAFYRSRKDPLQGKAVESKRRWRGEAARKEKSPRPEAVGFMAGLV
jgi:hypothetical protein